MTVLFGPEDAFYGTGRFGVASYGSVGPTKVVTGVNALFSAGSLTTVAEANVFPVGYNLDVTLGDTATSAEANTTLTGVNINFAVGELSVTSINRVVITGVSAAFTVGDPNVEGGTGAFFTLPSFPLQLDLGVVKPNLVTFVQGVTTQISLNDNVTATGTAVFSLTGVSAVFTTGTSVTDGVVFDFNQFASDFSSKRTIILPKVA